MKKYSFLILLFFSFSLTKSQDDKPWVDRLAKTVAFLRADKHEIINIEGSSYEVWLKPVSKDTLIPQIRFITGTGFFVTDTTSSFLCLVTASHVAVNMDTNSTITMSTVDDRPISFPFSKIVKKKPLSWFISSKADVAVIEINPDKEVSQHLQEHFILLQWLEDTLIAPSRDLPLSTIGFPLGLGIQERFSPISRESKPSSGLLILPRFDTKQLSTFYLLESPSVGGFSGAPLFELPGAYMEGNAFVPEKRIACVGLIHGTISDETGGKFAAVVPSYFIVKEIRRAISSQK